MLVYTLNCEEPLNHKRQVARDKTASNQQLLVTRLNAQAQEKREQQNWLRNEKLSLYNEFAQIALKIGGQAMDMNLPNLHTRLQRNEALHQVSTESLRLLASEGVIDKAFAFRSALYTHFWNLPEDRVEAAMLVHRRGSGNRVTQTLRELLNEMRDDLGSPRISQDFKWAIDDEPDKSN